MSQIIINEPKLKNDKLKSSLSVSSDLQKYIKNKDFFIEYDTDISVDESILNIPLTATVLPLAWLTGAEVKVDPLDRRFKESMDLLQKKFNETYPLGKFTTEIKASELVDNTINPKDPENHTGILFSGGVDSNYSLYKNMHLNPKLVMLWGVDDFPYPEKADYWNKVVEMYREWAEKKKFDFYLIKTNNSQILNDRRLEHQFSKVIYDGRLRPALQHSLVLLPLAAPLSMSRFDRFIIAASGTPKSNTELNPRAARPWFDEKIVWADLEVCHDGYISRNEKINDLRDFILKDGVTLKVCTKSRMVDGKPNDSECEKCLRTILSLVLAEVDPNVCGFKVEPSTFTKMRGFWENRKSSLSGSTWREIQELIPEEITYDIYGSKEFFEWFRGFDFESTERSWIYKDLYNALPFYLAQLLDKLYYKFGINIHESPKKRIKTLKS